MRKLILQPAEKLRNTHGPAFAPVAGTSLLWVSKADDDSFREATGAFFSFVTAGWSSLSSLRSRAMTSLQLCRTPTTAPSGEVPLCMVHKVAQEASRRTTPARALAHAVAPPLDRTSRSLAATVETAFATSI